MVCVDKRRQWSRWTNVWHSSAIRSTVYMLGAPVRAVPWRHPSPASRWLTSAGRDAVVVGAGPNGLVAAITLARAGRSVTVLEAADTVGGGSRSAELTLPGFVHDVCSAVHPLALASPFLRDLPLAEHGLELVHPEVPLAHPLDDGTAVLLARASGETAASLGGGDGRAYRRLMGPLVARRRRR